MTSGVMTIVQIAKKRCVGHDHFQPVDYSLYPLKYVKIFALTDLAQMDLRH